MKMTDRRALLKAFGFVVPIAIAASGSALVDADEIRYSPSMPKLTPRDVYEIYVSEMLTLLPARLGMNINTGRDSVLLALIQSQGAALATVLGYLQHENAA